MNNEEFKSNDNNIRNYNPEVETLEPEAKKDEVKYHSLTEALEYPYKKEDITMANIESDTSKPNVMLDTTEVEKPLPELETIPEPMPEPTPEPTTADIVDGILGKATTADLRDIRQGLAELQEGEKELENTNSMEMEKGKQRTLMMNRVNRAANRMNNSGFAQGFLFTLLAGFAAGAIFAIGYMVIALGDLTFTI